MGVRIYLDWNATAPLREDARVAMAAAMEVSGNPSSVHGEGRAARKLIESARENVATLVGAQAKNVIFTSGGTEANVLALTPQITDGKDTRAREMLLFCAMEHPSVGVGGRFKPEQVRNIAALASGQIDLRDLAAKVADLQTSGAGFLVSLMHANNETGVVQPVAEAAAIVHAAGGLLHVDAVQSAGKIPCDMGSLGADLLTISAHKIGGPKGVGALIKARDSLAVKPIFNGGGQERGARGGTENVIGIAGFGAAAVAAQRDLPLYQGSLAVLRDDLERSLHEIESRTVVFGSAELGHNPPARLPNTTLFAVPGVNAETALIALDLAGFAVSAGSACSSGKVSASHVLKAMGISDELGTCAIRLSIGITTTRAEIDSFLAAWSKHVASLSKEKRGLAA
jgi:cysteine desulfurase